MEEWTISELQNLQSGGQITARELVRVFIERIELIDHSGPKLNSVIEVNPDALDIAGRLDQERSKGQVRGPLHGIPILLKDNVDTADKLTTASGSLALQGSIAPQDAFLAARMREAGAVILGKANLSEWANFRSTQSISGWSSRAGQTRNPYALDRSPCGSSSGSAVAVSANLCTAAVGTETDGSIICPAQTNGIVGIKPTLGLISRAGVIPIAHSQDTAGPMARTVEDAAILLGCMTGLDPRDPATAGSQGKYEMDYTQFLNKSGLKGTRIGVARNFTGYFPKTEAIFEECLLVLKNEGAELIDPANIETAKEIGETEGIVLNYEFKADLNAYLAALGPAAPVHSLREIIEFNEKNRETVMPLFGQERMLQAQEKGPLTEEAYQKALETNHRLARVEGIDKVLREHNLQALVAMSGDPAWLVDIVNCDCSGGGGCTSPAAVAGYPHITVPAGQVCGLPVGLSFFSAAWSEPALLRLAYAFEQVTRARFSPQFKPTVII